MTDHPLSVDISFLLPPDGGCAGEAHSPRGADRSQGGREAVSALPIVPGGTFPASLDVIGPRTKRLQLGQEHHTDDATRSGAEVIGIEEFRGRRHG